MMNATGNTVKTATLNDGTVVIAKADGEPLKYTNRTQAARKAEALAAEGVAVRIYQPRLGPVRYLAVETK